MGKDGGLEVDLITHDGRSGTVEFRFCRDCVEVWFERRCCSVVDRTALRSWLVRPVSPLVVDDMLLEVDRKLDRDGRLSITLPRVWRWVLSPVDADRLRDRV